MSFYEGLSKKGNALLSFLTKGASEGIAARQVLLALRDQDLGYRASIFGKDYKIVLAAAKQFKGMTHLKGKDVVSKEWYMQSEMDMAKNYQTVVEIDVYNYHTKKEETMHVSVMHDKELTRDEIEADAISWLSNYEFALDVIKMTPTLARRVAELR